MNSQHLYVVVSGEDQFVGCAWAIGTWAECARWQMANGRRADTRIIPF